MWWHTTNAPCHFLKKCFTTLACILYHIKKFVATFLALNGVSTKEITPDPIYGILTFCDSYCFETSIE